MRLGRIFAPLRHCPRSEIDDGDVRRTGLGVEQGDGGPSREPDIRLPAKNVGLGRLIELHMRKSRVRAEPLFLLQYFGCQRDFSLAERIEWMTGILGGRWLCSYHIGPFSRGSG
jgi:hypothetical protein